MTFTPFNRVLKGQHTAQYLPKTLPTRLPSVSDAFAEFRSQFYINNCARLSALRAHCDTRWPRTHRKHGASSTEDLSGLIEQKTQQLTISSRFMSWR